MGSGNTKPQHPGVLADVDWFMCSSTLPAPPRRRPPSDSVAYSERHADQRRVVLTDAVRDVQVTLVYCRQRFVEVFEGESRWTLATAGLLVDARDRGSVSANNDEGDEGFVTLLTMAEKQIVRLRRDAALLDALSAVALLCELAGVPHTLSGFCTATDPSMTADGMLEDAVCGDCSLSLLVAPIFCSHTGKPHRGPRWSDASGLPVGAPQGCPSPKRKQQPESLHVAAADDRGEVASFLTPSGRNKLVLHVGGRLDLYAPTGEWMYSAQRVLCGKADRQLQMMCFETGLWRSPIRGVSSEGCDAVARLADRASISHNIWEEMGRQPTTGKKKTLRYVAFICQACTYVNTSGGACRMCGAAKPPHEPSTPLLPGQVEGDEDSDGRSDDAAEGTDDDEEESDVDGANATTSSAEHEYAGLTNSSEGGNRPATPVVRRCGRSPSVSSSAPSTPRRLRVSVCPECNLNLTDVPKYCMMSGQRHPLPQKSLRRSSSCSPTASPKSLQSERVCAVCNTVCILCVDSAGRFKGCFALQPTAPTGRAQHGVDAMQACCRMRVVCHGRGTVPSVRHPSQPPPRDLAVIHIYPLATIPHPPFFLNSVEQRV